MSLAYSTKIGGIFISVLLATLSIFIAFHAMNRDNCDLRRMESDVLKVTPYPAEGDIVSWAVVANAKSIESIEILKIACCDKDIYFSAKQATFKPSAFSDLVAIKHLKFLDVSGAKIPKTELPELQRCDSLKQLVWGPLPEADTLTWIQDCESLDDITLNATGFSAEQADSICRLQSLQWLALQDADLTRWQNLRSLPKLGRLTIASCEIPPTFWLQINDMQSLELVHIIRCILTDDDLDAMIAMRNDIQIEISNSQLPGTLSKWTSSLRKMKNIRLSLPRAGNSP